MLHSQYEYIEHTPELVQYMMDIAYGNNHELFFDTLCKNKNATKLYVTALVGQTDIDVDEFIKLFRLPSNITELGLPFMGKAQTSITLPPNIEKLILYRLIDIYNIDFTRNTKLKHIEINSTRIYDTVRNIDLSSVYSLETMKIMSCHCYDRVEIIQTQISENIKLPYGIVVEINGDE